MAIDGVEGVGIGEDQHGNEVLMVYLGNEAAKARVPKQVDGVSVRTTVTGSIDAQ